MNFERNKDTNWLELLKKQFPQDQNHDVSYEEIDHTADFDPTQDLKQKVVLKIEGALKTRKITNKEFKEGTLDRFEEYEKQRKHRLVIQKKEQMHKELEAYTLKPKINSQQNHEAPREPLLNRLDQIIETRNERKQKAINKYVSQKESELKECTFTPRIISKGPTRSIDDLLKWNQAKKQRIMEESLKKGVVESNTFKPKISKKSDQIAINRRGPDSSAMKVEDRLLKYLEHKKKKNFDEIQDRENHLASSYRSRSKSSIKSYRSGVSPTGMGKLKSKEETMTPQMKVSTLSRKNLLKSGSSGASPAFKNPQSNNKIFADVKIISNFTSNQTGGKGKKIVGSQMEDLDDQSVSDEEDLKSRFDSVPKNSLRPITEDQTFGNKNSLPKNNHPLQQQELQFSFKKNADLVKQLESCIDEVKRDLLSSSPMNFSKQNQEKARLGNPMKTQDLDKYEESILEERNTQAAKKSKVFTQPVKQRTYEASSPNREPSKKSENQKLRKFDISPKTKKNTNEKVSQNSSPISAKTQTRTHKDLKGSATNSQIKKPLNQIDKSNILTENREHRKIDIPKSPIARSKRFNDSAKSKSPSNFLVEYMNPLSIASTTASPVPSKLRMSKKKEIEDKYTKINSSQVNVKKSLEQNLLSEKGTGAMMQKLKSINTKLSQMNRVNFRNSDEENLAHFGHAEELLSSYHFENQENKENEPTFGPSAIAKVLSKAGKLELNADSILETDSIYQTNIHENIFISGAFKENPVPAKVGKDAKKAHFENPSNNPFIELYQNHKKKDSHSHAQKSPFL